MTSERTPGTRWVGAAVQRVEDAALLTGSGQFVDDLTRESTLHASFVRSPVAAATLRRVLVEDAARVPGVTAVFTADTLDAQGLQATLSLPSFVPVETPLLARQRLRFVGEPVAMVLATSPYIAEDAAELVELDYEQAAPVTDLEAAQMDGAPLVHENAPRNRLLDLVLRDDPDIDDVFSRAAMVVEGEFESGRVNATPLEARGCLAEWDRREHRLILYSSTQMPHLLRTTVAGCLGLAEHSVRVIAPDVGGAFGQKCVVAPEEVLVGAATRATGKPVKWVEDRRENLSSAFGGHEQRHRVRAAFDAEGTLLGVDADLQCDIGAYHCYPFTCGVEALMAAGEMPGPYKLPHYRVRTRAVATNKAPMAPYRGVSRPQITLVMERLMDKAARSLGRSRLDVRVRNLIMRDDFPFTGITGIVYDEGSYEESLERCAEALGFADWEVRQADARAEGRLLGLGLACFSERTGYGTPIFAGRGMGITPGYESAEIRMDPSGGVVVRVGTANHGQGHRTSLAQVVADELGLDLRDVRIVQGDTDEAPYGWGTFASRTAVIAGGASRRAARGLADKVRRVAAHLLEASPDDIELRDGTAAVRGSPDAVVPLSEVARVAYHAAQKLPEGETAGLYHVGEFDPPGTFSNATHGAVVEIDERTGETRILRYVVVEDCGVVINPLIVEGQVHGGVAQGIACALYEQLVYDDEGQCQTATLMDYLVPTATEIPPIEIIHLETPSKHSETGAKGMGEGGTIGAPATLLNAINDALAHLDIEVDAIPATPGLIRSKIEACKAGAV